MNWQAIFALYRKDPVKANAMLVGFLDLVSAHPEEGLALIPADAPWRPAVEKNLTGLVALLRSILVVLAEHPELVQTIITTVLTFLRR